MFELENTLYTRKNALRCAKEYSLKKVNFYFKKILGERGMKGAIEVTEEDECDTLNTTDISPQKTGDSGGDLRIYSMPCQDNGANELNSVTDIRSLSGGERSFSTVAFVVSLWNISKVPFRILDEVDVFMDYLTRRASLEVLVSFAQSGSQGQFLFLSPLSIPDLEPSPKVKIFSMPTVQR